MSKDLNFLCNKRCLEFILNFSQYQHGRGYQPSILETSFYVSVRVSFPGKGGHQVERRRAICAVVMYVITNCLQGVRGLESSSDRTAIC